MNILIEPLTCIISCILSRILFGIIFGALNQSMLKLFLPIQKRTVGLKKKKLFEGIAFFTCIFISVIIKDFFYLNYIGFGILIGLFSSLSNIIFAAEREVNI